MRLCGCVRVCGGRSKIIKKRKKRDGDCGDYEEILAGGKVVIFNWVWARLASPISA